METLDLDDAAVTPKAAVQAAAPANLAIGDAFGSYPGGKSGAGTYQTIINQQPPHETFISAFLGHCGIMRNKRPAARNIGIDLDPGVIDRWRCSCTRLEMPSFRLLCEDALEYLPLLKLAPQDLVYCDPPYLMETRSSGRLYQHEMPDDQHRKLLTLVKTLNCMVQISGYPSELYARELTDWRMIEFDSMTRGGLRRECLWMNYPDPASLHTTWYVGDNYRERERIKRKRQRWVKRLTEMPPLERQLIREALLKVEADDIAPPNLPVLASTAADVDTVPT